MLDQKPKRHIMEKKKNNKLLIMVIILAISILSLLLLPKRDKGHTKDKAVKEIPANTVNDYWEQMDKKADIMAADTTPAMEEPIEEVSAETEDKDVTRLSIYPAPSYVSAYEDTLIYRKGIYVRTGFVEEKHHADTITIDGQKYIRL